MENSCSRLLDPGKVVRVFLLSFLSLWLIVLLGCATKSGYVRSHPYMEKQDREALLKGEVRPGFDKDMVELSLGYPSNMSSVITTGGEQEVWLYVKNVWVPVFGTVKSEYRYIYFQDGKVVKVQVTQGKEKYQEKMERVRVE